MRRLLLLAIVLGMMVGSVNAALTITSSSVTDWTALAAETVAESGEIDLSGSYATFVHVQAFLDTATAHEGTEFLVQVASNAANDEDWHTLFTFTGLIGTANSEAITNNPLAAASQTITVASTTGYTMDATSLRWIAIEDGTLVNSELILQSAFVTDTSISCVDPTTNEHAAAVNLWNIAISKTFVIPMGAGSRARVIINNRLDNDATASSLNYRVRKTIITALN